MRKTLMLMAVLVSVCAFAMAQRLPELAVPINYQLNFTPDFSADKFAGTETIQIEVKRPTAEIVLNSAQIEFRSATISSGGQMQTARVTLDKDKEMATLAVEKPLAAGPATVHIEYTGILNDELRGLYLGKDKEGRKYAVTQFEATDARRAFPSFDEPAYKATFDITAVADKGLTAISNGKVISDTPGPGEKHTVKFATTAKMSSYLVALAVGNFEYVEGSADGIPIRVWGPPGSKQYAKFALEISEECMKYFNHYFGIKYPFEKLDEIGLPDFAAGAMENTGFITYREVILLVDSKSASVGLRKSVATVIAHEMAHQWFGDMVTMQWWDDIWLNEGFATWMESKAIAEIKPEWHLELDDVEDTNRALGVDGLQNTRPIHQAAETPAQIQELFDGIAYGKTAAVLRMLEAYLGPESFRAGVDTYLKQHAYGNATAGDFWKTLAETSKKPVDTVMPTFVNQPGAPMVGAQTQCTGGNTTVTLSQKRYFDDRKLFDTGNDELWQVPVCMKAAQGQSKCVLLTKKEDNFTLPGCGTWVMVNAGAHGYYHSVYSAEAMRVMSHDLEKDLTPAERIMLLNDSWAAVRVGQQKIGDYLALAEGLQSDRNRAVIEALTSQLDYISENVVSEQDRSGYERWVRQLLTPAAKELGWAAKPGDTDETKTLRSRVLFTLGYAGKDPEVLAQARKLTDEALANPSSIDHTMAFTAFRLAAKNGDASLYDRIAEKLANKGATPEEYYLYFGTLSEFSDPKLLSRTLDLAVSPSVRSQDSLGLISAVMENPAGAALSWDFVRAHWSDIEKVGGGFTSGEVVAATSSFCDAHLRDEVEDFFATHQVPSAERTLKQSIERMNYCVDLKTQQAPQLSAWLEQHRGAAGR